MIPAAVLRSELDRFDFAILREIQLKGRATQVELSLRVGLSPPIVLSRLRRLKHIGVLKGYRAILSQERTGYNVVMFITVELHSASLATEETEFERFVNCHRVVRESWLMSDGRQFLMKCCASKLTEIKKFVMSLTKIHAVRSIRTAPALKQTKCGPPIPFPEVPL